MGAPKRSTDQESAVQGDLINRPSIFLVRPPGDALVFKRFEQELSSRLGGDFSAFGSLGEVISGGGRFPKAVLLVISVTQSEQLEDLEKFHSWLSKNGLNWATRVILINRMPLANQLPSTSEEKQLERGFFIVRSQAQGGKILAQVVNDQLSLLARKLQDPTPEIFRRLSLVANQLPQFKLQWLPAHSNEADFWFVPPERFVFQLDQKWFISMRGPSEGSGFWLPLGSQSKTQDCEEQVWLWLSSRFKDVEKPPMERWEFTGLRPQFDGARWVFGGSRPKLEYVTGSSLRFQRFLAVSQDELLISRNSAQVRNFLKPQFFSDEELSAVAQNSPFQSIETEEELRGLLEQAHLRGRIVKLWCKGSSTLFHSKLQQAPNLLSEIQLCLKFPEQAERLKEEIRRQQPSMNQVVLGRFGLRSGEIFISAECEISVSQPGKLTASIAGPAFIVQRRAFQRFEVPNDWQVSAEIDGIARRVVDISAGGLCILIEEAEAKSFSVGQVISPLLRFFDLQMPCSGTVRWVRPLESPGADVGQILYGLEFQAIQDLDSSPLYLLLFELSLQYQQGE